MEAAESAIHRYLAQLLRGTKIRFLICEAARDVRDGRSSLFRANQRRARFPGW